MTNSCSSTISFPILVATAIAKEALNQGYDIDFSLVNKSRSSINKGVLTYFSLYKVLPFDNEILLIEAKGNEIYNQANYNSVYNYRDITTNYIRKNKKINYKDYSKLDSHYNV